MCTKMENGNILDLFNREKPVKVCAPMVRYSKLAFRSLVRKYDCDVCFTPMIIAADFMRSAKARDSEFTTNKIDRPLVVQFAAKDAQTLADAACEVSPFSDGVDLNCGCPQRIHKDLRKTVDLCQKVEAAGVSWITVHGRTADERHQPVHYDAIKTIKDSLSIPVIANGDIKSMMDVDAICELTGVDGVMAARGLLANPAMFSGVEETPLKCVWDWVDVAVELGTPFSCFHHHLIYMLERITSQPERRVFNNLSSTAAVIDFLQSTFGSPSENTHFHEDSNTGVCH
ncbi:hypothetical protein DNTS_006226 [Danionella cerebrum]|uniref:tRNA-dihydrouridine synthase n=1 Tax=Danionella cerebrum TaxID=2873325 RepID=A0A553QD79_9TELE|nr:hypothetical protein DNTS_006226 [Danionella translucida]TRY87876.1 hypothetical protein DNTS_006226 [Danionella translucida]